MAKRLKPKIKRKIVAILLLLVFAFVSSIFISQTKLLLIQDNELQNINKQIEAAKQNKQSLLAENELTVTDEYKKDIAKTRDGLVFPNELIFVDASAID